MKKGSQLKYIVLFIISFSLPSFAEDYATILKTKGVVKVDGREVKIGDKVSVGKTIMTEDSGSYVDISLPWDSGTVRIVGGTFKIEKTTETGSILSLIKGKLFGFFRPTKNNKETEIRTQMASYGIRGTRLVLEIEDQKENFICVCHGKVEVTNEIGSTVTLTDEKYHCCSMDKCRNWCRTFHRIRQPHMERKLSRFCHWP